jgi:predicted P-loop ATPase
MNVARDKISIIDGGKDDGPARKRSSRGGAGGGKYSGDDWRNGLIYTNQGHAKGLPHNVMLVLENDPELADLFWLDDFANSVALSRSPPWTGGNRDEFTEADALELAAWLGSPFRYSMAAGVELILQCVEAIARRKRRHPAREYLNALKWDGEARVARMFVDLFGCAETSYTLGAAMCFMVSAVSRVLLVDPLQPSKGSKVDFMLVLEGEQGTGKTTAVLELCGAKWYAEATESPAHKDFYQSLRGRLFVEIGEMDSFSKADVAKVKQAITVRFDVYRPSYGRLARAFRRECIFVGTTNRNDYLRDETGARRFLPIKIGRVDIPALVAARDQLWAEAVQLFRDGFQWWQLPPGAEREQNARFSDDVWTDAVWRWLEGKADAKAYEAIPIDRRREHVIEECTASEVLAFAIGMERSRQDRQGLARVGSIMARLGWDTYRPVRDGERIRFYWRPDEPADG